MSIKEEFREAYLKEFGIYDEVDIALWAAKWMAERCAKYIESQSLPDAYSEPVLDEFGKEIRQLAKELQ